MSRNQSQVSVELTHIPKAKEDLAQQTLRMVYNATRNHDLSIAPLTPPGDTLSRAIEITRQQFPAFEPRYDQSFFQP